MMFGSVDRIDKYVLFVKKITDNNTNNKCENEKIILRIRTKQHTLNNEDIWAS